ncbi:MAG: ABC transporter ATP-binding protein/permease [Erysipelotrichaceae bacterium]|nr:ABC transporter ATP-binding protein/permease [Erysipelotrichaceae bacterium]
MKLILYYLKRYKKWLLLDMISVLGFALVELGLPTIISNMIDGGITNNDINYLHQMWALAIMIAIIGVLGTISLGYCSARISTSITCDIRNDIFSKVQSFSPAEFDKFGISSLITRTNNDAYQIQLFVNTLLRTALLTPVMVIVSFALTLTTSLELSLIIVATLPFIVIGVIVIAKLSQPLSIHQQASLDALNRISRENLTGLKIIRAFNNDKYEQTRFNETNDDYTKYTKKIFRLMTLSQPIFWLFMNIVIMIIYYVSATMIDANTLQVGKVVAFQDYVFHAMYSMMLFCTVFMMYPRANVSAKRIQAVLNTSNSIIDEGKNMSSTHACSIVFNHVNFAYPKSNELSLTDISFSAHSGETIAFIGSTGSGKSTLVNLIPRFYNITSGNIYIDDININEYSMTSLRNKIGFVPQKATLFSGTIAQNIRYGKSDATMEELEHAAKISQSLDFILEKENGFDELISESATNVSGGQRQRLSIARAIIKKPEIYIFDDSFSALDFKTDVALRQALKAETKDAIVMIVAQRISTIMDASKIIVLDKGKIVGVGTHQQLLQNCEIYQQIAYSQLSEEELYG